MSQKDNKRSIYFTKEHIKELERIQKEIGVPISVTVRKALEIYLKKKK
jgi:Zn-dependent peptidase ImmA (M78 family)